MTITRLIIAQYERALVWKSIRFAGILQPGVRWIVTPFANVAVQLYDMTVPEFEHPRVDLLLKEAREEMERHFDIVELTEQEVGVVYKNGKLAGVLPPGKRQLYWKGPVDVSVTKIDISNDLEVPAQLAKLMARAKQPLAGVLADAVTTVEVPDTSVALLIVDGAFTKLLGPGLHVFWKYQRVLKAELDREIGSTARASTATRSLLNTARLMDENPTLLRPKELETLEKVTEKVDKLTVFGGLEGVLKDVVRIQVPAS